MNPDRPISTEVLDQRTRLRGKYQAILGKQLTPADIDAFADRAVQDVIALSKEVTDAYAQEKSLIIEGDKRKNIEDEAFKYYGLQNISGLLDKAHEKLEEMQVISNFTVEHINQEHLQIVITPPEKNARRLEPGNGDGFAPDMIPRLKTILFILKERGVSLDQITLVDGIVTPDMIRQTSYVTVVIPQLDRLAQVCDEEGNASYVFKLSAVNVDTTNRMTKPEKEELLKQQPGIGVRFKQGPNWRERAELYLFEEIPEEEEKTKSVPSLPEERPLTPHYGELDPWNGFVLDEQGKHWGIRAAITKKLGKSFVIFKKRINDSRLETRTVFDAVGRIQKGYCFEQITEFFPELITERPVEKEGEWAGYWTDPGTGKHWAASGTLLKKFEVNDWKTIKQYAEKNNLPSLKITDPSGRQTDAYCYEDFLIVESFMELLTAPQVEKEGEWAGYWTDGEGKHWASTKVLGDHFKVADVTIARRAQKANLPVKKIRGKGGEVVAAFRREDLETDNELMEFLAAPEVESEGEWVGFWIDEDGKHWGTKFHLARKLKVKRGTLVEKIIATHPELHSQLLKDTKGKPVAGFCYEEIFPIVKSVQ